VYKKGLSALSISLSSISSTRPSKASHIILHIIRWTYLSSSSNSLLYIHTYPLFHRSATMLVIKNLLYLALLALPALASPVAAPEKTVYVGPPLLPPLFNLPSTQLTYHPSPRPTNAKTAAPSNSPTSKQISKPRPSSTAKAPTRTPSPTPRTSPWTCAARTRTCWRCRR